MIAVKIKGPLGSKSSLEHVTSLMLGLHAFVLPCTGKSGGLEGIFTASRSMSRLSLAFLAGGSCFWSFGCSGLHATGVKGQSTF